MRKPSSPRAGVSARDDRGFTLVELIVAIVILAIVFVPLLHAFVTGAQTEAKSRRYQSATAAAQNIIETVQAKPVDTLLQSGGASAYIPDGYTATASFVKEARSDADVLTGYVSDRSDPSVSYNKTTNMLDYSGRIVELDNLTVDKFNCKALINVVPDTAVNGTAVSVNNPADASIDMTAADVAALDEVNMSCADKSGGVFTMEDIHRSLTRHANITSDYKDGKYTVTIVFTYSGTLTYSYTYDVTVTDAEGNQSLETRTGVKTVTFGSSTSSTFPTITEQISPISIVAPDETAAVQLKREGRAAYSLYVRFYAWYSPKLSGNTLSSIEAIDIHNNYSTNIGTSSNNNLDFNLFLIESTSDTSTVSSFYQPIISYHNQYDMNYARVFTNIKFNSFKNYWAIKVGGTTGVQKQIEGSLVEKKQIDRAYNITVKIFDADDDLVSAKPKVTLTGTKLR